MASLSELQKSVEEFTRKHNLETATEYRLLDLTSEVGELCKARLKNTNYARRQYHDGPHFGWVDELGDVLYSLVCLANNDEIDLEMALGRALAKYRDRIESPGQSRVGAVAMLPPLKLKLTDIQTEFVQSAIDEQIRRKEFFLGPKRPVVTDGVLTVDPHDFIFLMVFIRPTAENELEAYRLRMEGVREMKSRMETRAKDATWVAYSSLIDHSKKLFAIGSAKDESQAVRRRPGKLVGEL